MSLNFKPKRVPQNQPLVHPNYDLPCNEGVQPIWGEQVVRMIEVGGHLDKSESDRLILTKPNGNPRNAMRGREYYPGSFSPDEPVPSVSDYTSTVQLARLMWRSGWTEEQVEHFFLYTDKPGTLYYRWRMSTDKEHYNLHTHIWETLPETETDPYFTKNKKVEDDKGVYGPITPLSSSPSTEVKDYSTRDKEIDALLVFINQNPGLSSTELRRSSIYGIHPFRMGQVIKDTEALGLIVAKSVRKNPKARACKVWSVVPPKPFVPAPDVQALLAVAS